VKAFAFVGSMRGTKSNGYRKVKEFLDMPYWKEYEKEIITADMVEISRCRGCSACFTKGICMQDQKDDMQKIKQKLLEADVIILASPVYLHQVSGAMKDFVDRISYWTHIFRLIGKRAIVFSVSGTNGNEYVDSYLKKVLTTMGCYVAGCMDIQINKEDYKEEFNEVIEKLEQSFQHPEQCKPTAFQQELYDTFRNRYIIDEVGCEAAYWFSQGYFQYDSFEQLLKAYL